jgi:UDP-D-galactose:(glucosyl)LPS alpha-1,6-D-galactosyltransferase
MKILIILTHNLNKHGGAEKVLYDFLSFLDNIKNKVEVVVLNIVNKKKFESNPILKFEKYNIVSLETKIPLKGINFLIKNFFYLDFDFVYYKTIQNFLKKYNDFDLIIAFDEAILLNTICTIVFKLGINSKIVNWEHGKTPRIYYTHLKVANDQRVDYLRKIYTKTISKFILKEIEEGIKKTEYHLCISSGIERIIKEINPQAKTYLVYNPVEIKEEELIDRGKENEFIYVGRLDDYQKNISFMLEGLSRLKKYKWRLRIIGKGPDEKKLRELSKRLGIEERVIWEGFKENPYKDLKEVKALLLTSRYEGLPLVLIEANVRGIPFISSNCLSGPEDIVIEGVNGYLYQEGNIEDFVNKVEKVIKGELKFANPQEIRKTAYKFEKNIILNKIFTILKDICKG